MWPKTRLIIINQVHAGVIYFTQDELLESVILPQFGDIDRDNDVKIRKRVAQILLDVIHTCHTTRCLEVLQLLQGVSGLLNDALQQANYFQWFIFLSVSSCLDICEKKSNSTIITHLKFFLREKQEINTDFSLSFCRFCTGLLYRIVQQVQLTSSRLMIYLLQFRDQQQFSRSVSCLDSQH